jgi:carbamoylphosphate synthase large subunit
MIRILITSVGSLVGQNILDLLEERREFVTVIGLNSIPESQRIFRCDKAYLVPSTANHSEFEEAFRKIIDKEVPDIILAGRDEDVVFLAEYKKNNPLLKSFIPVGEPYLAEMMNDKYESYVFAQKNNLPFADTFLYENIGDAPKLEAFLAKHDFPVLVKPRKGFASLNVFLVTNKNQVEAMLAEGNEILFQEYLSPTSELDLYIEQLKKGIPLFFQIPLHDHMVSQVIISQNGQILDSISTKQTLILGRTEFARVYEDDELNSLIESYSRILAAQGWWGFLNIQSRLDKNNKWRVFELNPRLTGASSARLLLGMDELGSLLNAEKPEWKFPMYSNRNMRKNHIYKYLSDYAVDENDIRDFKENKKWIKK